ncbi:SRSF protein kinase 1-like [Cucumis melo var. makuwa]|uniref:SRSF protein kinase 1-like n=1 Tax=Cucumis melo var. makuwa TaxID=1194695 RepID=A0A5A7T4N9_CUCMM|nr:SRSF protein kinase 1-like [Cucumis melo var. makuwa]TYK27301.1 SRSF protein kinase 1-like [Cucumis melo var. makuwa]
MVLKVETNPETSCSMNHLQMQSRVANVTEERQSSSFNRNRSLDADGANDDKEENQVAKKGS